MRSPNSGQSLLQKWILKCVNKKYNAKIKTFLKSTTSTSPTAESGASSLPSIGWSFMYVESSGNKYGANHISVSCEKLILYIFLTQNFIIIGFQQLIKIFVAWVVLEFSYY